HARRPARSALPARTRLHRGRADPPSRRCEVNRASTALAVAAAILAANCRAQDARPVAFTNARLLTVDGPPIERGTLVVKDGVITALGKDAAAPAGAQLVDC